MDIKSGEVLYSEGHGDFFYVTNVGDTWVFGAWSRGNPKGMKESINIFRKTSYLELQEKLNSQKPSQLLGHIRRCQIITDPFPEHSLYESLGKSENKILDFLGLEKKMSPLDKPDEISIWEAYMIGYKKAYKEIEEGLKSRGL